MDNLQKKRKKYKKEYFVKLVLAILFEPLIFLWMKPNRDDFLNYLRNLTFQAILVGFVFLLSVMPINPVFREIGIYVGGFITLMSFLANSWFLLDVLVFNYKRTVKKLRYRCCIRCYIFFCRTFRFIICLVIILFFAFMLYLIAGVTATNYLRTQLDGAELLPKHTNCINLYDQGNVELYKDCIRK